MFKILNLNLKYFIKVVPYLFVLSILIYFYQSFLFFTFFLPWILIISIIQKETQNSTNILFCSLPIKRDDFVKGIYLSAFIYNAISMIYSVFAYYIIYRKNINLFDISETLYTLLFPQILAIAFLLPLHFKFGFNLDFSNNKLVLVFIVIPIAFCLMFLFSLPLISENDLTWIVKIKKNIYISNLVALIILYLSMLLSIKFYKKREF